MDLTQFAHFDTLCRERRACRHFTGEPIPDGELREILDTAHWAPSGYNLQPTHFLVVTDAALKERLVAACMDQPQVREAAAVVIFLGDRQVALANFDEVLRLDREAGAINDVYEKKLRGIVPLAFGHGPLGIGWLWKALLPPLLRCAIRVPSLPAVEKRFWLTKQAMLAAMAFMYAAAAAGYATVPMEGFDERRVRRIMQIPRRYIIPVVIPIGHAAPGTLKKTRLPIEKITHWNKI